MKSDVHEAWLAGMVALDDGVHAFPIWTGTLADFATDNGLLRDEAIDIARDLRDCGEYVGGGGAAAEYRLTVAA